MKCCYEHGAHLIVVILKGVWLYVVDEMLLRACGSLNSSDFKGRVALCSR